MSVESRLSTKLFIPHPQEQGCNIVGILEQLTPSQPTQGRKIALILHGTMGHKDYLFQKRLALKLPLDSFRFDFRGNHETGGTWKQGALQNDLVDLQVVVDFLKKTYGYAIELVVGHSRGAIVAFRWLASTEDGRNAGAFVNASGRYRMAKIWESPAGKIWKESFAKQGHHTWTVTVARKELTARIAPQDLEEFTSWDPSFVWDQFPATTDVLSLHGLADTTVPPYDALIYASALGTRSPGTHTLHLMEDADHNFTGKQDDVVSIILQWWDLRQRAKAEGAEGKASMILKSGVWVPGMGAKGKL
ncbi:ectomycorrhiza-regulated esterase [Panaeolus papilionaceus]|nr:ectomycorrhiza-regulated esterase [Panaeolus papilionaceus]